MSKELSKVQPISKQNTHKLLQSSFIGKIVKKSESNDIYNALIDQVAAIFVRFSEDTGIALPENAGVKARNIQYIVDNYGMLQLPDIQEAFDAFVLQKYTAYKKEAFYDTRFQVINPAFICKILNAYIDQLLPAKNKERTKAHYRLPEKNKEKEIVFWRIQNLMLLHESWIEFSNTGAITNIYVYGVCLDLLESEGIIDKSEPEYLFAITGEAPEPTPVGKREGNLAMLGEISRLIFQDKVDRKKELSAEYVLSGWFKACVTSKIDVGARILKAAEKSQKELDKINGIVEPAYNKEIKKAKTP